MLLVCRQALGGQKYLVKTGKKSLEKHYLVETEDSDNDDSAQYGSVEGNIFEESPKEPHLASLCVTFSLFW